MRKPEVTYLKLVEVPAVNAMGRPLGYTVPRIRRVVIERIKHWIVWH
jgi:hypothetical protein